MVRGTVVVVALVGLSGCQAWLGAGDVPTSPPSGASDASAEGRPQGTSDAVPVSDGASAMGLRAAEDGPDADKDGLTDADEARLGTNPNHRDSDGDGKGDGAEVHTYKTDPLNVDSDGDGIFDGAEIARGMDPLTPDLGVVIEQGQPPEPDEPPPRFHPDTPIPSKLRCGEDATVSSCFLQIEGGAFRMGAQATDPEAPGYDPKAQLDEGPVHEVTVSSFWIQRGPVTTADFETWLEDTETEAEPLAATGGFSNLGKAERAYHPMNSVTWEGARQYCAWLGARLPTEAEWEYVARGAEGRRFPWGDDPRCGFVSTGSGAGAGEEVSTETCAATGTFGVGAARGDSPFGVTGMANNVWEWTADWYAADAYAGHAATDPTGPEEGTERVQRGGGWTARSAWELRSAARASLAPDLKVNDVGFRCVRQH